MPASSSDIPETNFYPASVIAGKSILVFSPIPKPENEPVFEKAYFLKTYNQDGSRAGMFIIHRIHDRPWITCSKNTPAAQSAEPISSGFDCPAPILSDDGQFLTFANPANHQIYRIKKNEAIALGFIPISLNKFLETCHAHPELLRNIIATVELVANDQDTTESEDAPETTPTKPEPIRIPDPTLHLEKRAPQTDSIAYPERHWRPIARPRLLRIQPDDEAPLVEIELPHGGGALPKITVVAARPDHWFEIELHYRFKYTSDPERGVGTALFDKTFRGYWRAPLDAFGYPTFLLRLPKDEAAFATLLDAARDATPPTLRWGYIDRTGKFIIAPEYLDAANFSEEMAFVRHEHKSRSGYITPDGQLAIAGVAGVGSFQDGRARVALKQRPDYTDGYIDRQGQTLQTPPLRQKRDFAYGIATVTVEPQARGGDRPWKYLKADGSFFEIPGDSNGYTQITHFSEEGLAAVCKASPKLSQPRDQALPPPAAAAEAVLHEGKKHWRIVDKTGATVGTLQGRAVNFFDIRPDRPGIFHDGLAFVENDHGQNRTTTAYIDKTGKEVISPADEAHEFRYDGFSEQRAVIKTKDATNPSYGYIDTTGKVVIPLRYQNGFLFREGLAAVFRDGKCAYIDPEGQEVIPPLFNIFYPSIDTPSCDFNAPSFHEGLALVEKHDGRLCYIDKTGSIVIELPENTVAARVFSEGRAAVAVLVPASTP